MARTRSGGGKPARKQPIRSSFGAMRPVRRGNASWFFHPEMQARIAEAEADLLNGRFDRTHSAEEMQQLLDSWKR